MDRLIKDAMKLDKTFKVATKTTGKGKKANKELAYSYADIIQAIHIVQNEMGITGTTAKEAEHTISGSLNMVKAAWRNLLSGLGEGNDRKVDMLVEQLIYSAEKALDNLLPVIENALYGIATMIEGLAPVIADKLPAFMERILPPLTRATATLVTAFTKALIQNMPVIIDCAKQILKATFDAIQEEAPGLIPILLGVGGAKVAATGIKTISGIKELLTTLGIIKAGGAAAQAAAASAGSAATSAAGAASTAGITLIGVLSKLGVAALAAGDALLIAYDVQKFNDAYKGYKDAGDAHMKERETAIENYRQLVKEKGLAVANEWAQSVYGIKSTTHNAWLTERAILHEIEAEWKGVPTNLWDGFKQGWDHYFGANGEGFMALIDDGLLGPIKGLIESAWNWGKDLIESFTNGIKAFLSKPIEAISGLASRIRALLGFSEPEEGPLSNFHTYAPDMMKLFAQGITDNRRLITDAISGAFNLNPQIANAMSVPQEYTTPRPETGGNMTIVVKLPDDTELGRAVYRMYNSESRRVGASVTGGGY